MSGGIEVETERAGNAAAPQPSSSPTAASRPTSTWSASFGISPAPEKLLPRNGGTAVGDGIRMAQSLGARDHRRRHEQHLRPHPQPRRDERPPGCGRGPIIDELAASGIVVDASGRRFADEGLGGIWLTNAIARLPDPLGTTIIFDQPIWDGARPQPRAAAESAGAGGRRHAASRRHAGRAGRTWSALPPQRLEETVARIQRGARRRHAAKAVAAAAATTQQAVADQDAAVLRHADLRRDHQHHGRHRGGRRRPRARQKRQADPRPLRRGLDRRRARRRPARRLRRRPDQGHHRACAPRRRSPATSLHASTASECSPPSPARDSPRCPF